MVGFIVAHGESYRGNVFTAEIAENAEVFDRMDRIHRHVHEDLLNFGARNVTVTRKVKELRYRSVYPVILSKRGLLPSHPLPYS